MKATTPSPAAAACEHDDARDRGTQHPASAKSARRDISLTSCDQREVRTIGVIATTRSIRAGWLTAHCRACMPPIEAPTTAARRPTPSASRARRCDSTMSRMVNAGNVMPGWRALFEGEVERPFPSASMTTMQNRRLSSQVRPDQEIEPMVRAADGGEPRIAAVPSRASSPCTTVVTNASCSTAPDSSGGRRCRRAGAARRSGRARPTGDAWLACSRGVSRTRRRDARPGLRASRRSLR